MTNLEKLREQYADYRQMMIYMNTSTGSNSTSHYNEFKSYSRWLEDLIIDQVKNSQKEKTQFEEKIKNFKNKIFIFSFEGYHPVGAYGIVFAKTLEKATIKARKLIDKELKSKSNYQRKIFNMYQIKEDQIISDGDF